MSSEALLPGPEMADFACPHMMEGVRELSEFSLIRALSLS